MVKNRRPGRSKRTSRGSARRISSSIARRSGKTIARKPAQKVEQVGTPSASSTWWMTRAVTRAGEAGCGVEGEGVGGRRVRDGRAGRGAEWGEEEARLGGGYARRRGSGGGRDLDARAGGKKRPAEGWRRRGVRADGRTRTRARGGGSGRAARPRRPRRPRTRRRAPRTSGPARRRRRASRVRRTLRGGGERRVRPRALLFFHGLARRRARRGRAW